MGVLLITLAVSLAAAALGLGLALLLERRAGVRVPRAAPRAAALVGLVVVIGSVLAAPYLAPFQTRFERACRAARGCRPRHCRLVRALVLAPHGLVAHDATLRRRRHPYPGFSGCDAARAVTRVCDVESDRSAKPEEPVPEGPGSEHVVDGARTCSDPAPSPSHPSVRSEDGWGVLPRDPPASSEQICWVHAGGWLKALSSISMAHFPTCPEHTLKALYPVADTSRDPEVAWRRGCCTHPSPRGPDNQPFWVRWVPIRRRR